MATLQIWGRQRFYLAALNGGFEPNSGASLVIFD